MRHISRRTIDLNALCFAMDGYAGDIGRPQPWGRWKKRATAEADRRLAAEGFDGGPHDAGWDAARALYALEHLRRQIRGASATERATEGDQLAEKG